MLRLISACLLLCTMTACSLRLPTVSWPTLSQVQASVTLIKDTVTALSALAMVYIAYLGLQAWKKQLRGKTDYQLARKMLRDVYGVRDAVVAARNPVQFGTESVTAAYEQRWQAIREALAKLDVSTLEAQALWGEEIPKLVESLRAPVDELYVNTLRYLDKGRQPAVPMSREESLRIQQVVFETSKGDAFGSRMEETVGEFEDYLRRKLKL